MNKEELENLKVSHLTCLDVSPDGKTCYGSRTPSGDDITEKLNELIDKYNKLVEVIANANSTNK